MIGITLALCLAMLPRPADGLARMMVLPTGDTSNGCSNDHWFRNSGHSGGVGDCSGGSDAGDPDIGDGGGGGGGGDDDGTGNVDPPPVDDGTPPSDPGECVCGQDVDCDDGSTGEDCNSGAGDNGDSGDTDGDGDVDQDDDDDQDDPPLGRYTGFLWGGAASVYLNGIGTPSVWESNLIRPGETAGPLAATPERAVVPSSGYGIDENTDLVVELPGRNFELTRNFSGNSQFLRWGSFGPFAMGGWTLSTDAYVYASLVPVSPPMKVVGGDNWKRMGIVVLVQSPIRSTIGFQNYLAYKPEAAWATAPGQLLGPPPAGETPEECRTFRPMGPGLARITAERLTFRTPFRKDYSPTSPPVTLPVWKVVEPGRGTSYFFRNCESETTCTNLARSGGGFDEYPYPQATLDKVPNGRLWCQFDEYGNVWSYEYIFKKVQGGETPRLAAIYLHGENEENARAVVRFGWDLMRGANGLPIGSKLWHLKWVEVERPYRNDAGATTFKRVKPERVDYTYHGDLVKMLEGASDNPALGQLHDDLILVAKRTGVHLPMSVDSRDGIGEGEIGHSTQITHYRYGFVPNPSDPGKSSVQIKGVYGPAQIDAFARNEWSTTGENASKLWEIGFQLKPEWADESLYQDATALALLTLNDVALIEPMRGAGTGSEPLKLWQAADRWTTFHGHPRTVPPSGDGSIGSNDAEHLGRLRAEYSRPGVGGPTLRRDFLYGTSAQDLEDSILVKRRYRVWPDSQQPAFNLDHSYRLRGSVQQVTEWTRTTDLAAPPPESELWDDDFWIRRRRITTRSEERELFSFGYQWSKADGTPLGLKSLVSAVPFTVAELVEDVDPESGERRRSWLTIHEFDANNRPSRTLDPGAFTVEYPPVDAPLADPITCRLMNWRAFVETSVDSARLGSLQSTAYQDTVGPTTAFASLLTNPGGQIYEAGGNTHYEMNYPSTLRAQKKFIGNQGAGALMEYQVHRGALTYFGGFQENGVDFRRPDLISSLHRSRTGADVPLAQADQFESSTFAYGLKVRRAEMGYPAVVNVVRSSERELETENGPSGSGSVSFASYLDDQGREKFRVGPDGVAIAFEYGAHGPDLTGRAELAHQHVLLADGNGDGTPDTFELIPWDDQVGTLSVSALHDVSGNLLKFVNADGVASARAYQIQPYVDPFDESAPPIPTVVSLIFPPLAGIAERAGAISASFLDGAGRVFRASAFAPVSIASTSDGIVTEWQLGQEFSRTQTGYYLSGAVERETSYPFASVGGVFPAAIPNQENDRSLPVVAYYAYDGDASPTWSKDAAGNTETIEYDALSRPTRTYRGVDGVPELLVESKFYDGEGPDRLGIGNGLLTRVESYVDSTQTAQRTRVLRQWYDMRDRPTLRAGLDPSGNAVSPFSATVLDNLDRPVLSAQLSTAVSAPEGMRFTMGA